MLVEFEVGNFLSFKDPVQLSMEAATPFHEYEAENVFHAQRLRLLKSAAIYGANASGKSNLLDAMEFMRRFVLSSAKDSQSVEPIAVTPFKFDAATESAPSRFQIVFILNDLRYRYGFEVDAKVVRSEWLFCAEANKEHPLFLRKDDGIEVMQEFEEGKGLEARTRDNALFLSTADQWNGVTAKALLDWFLNLKWIHGLQDEEYKNYTLNMLRDEKMRPVLLDIIRLADFGIEDINIEEKDTDASHIKNEMLRKLMINRPRLSIWHPKFSDGARAGSAQLDFNREESEGTKKFIRMAGPVLDCLKNGYVVAIDELDAKLHPFLTRAIIRLFHNPEINSKNAQLIFGTHDTNLLSYGKFRRDQIWFMEKSEQGATELYSLAEIKVRKDASFEKDYIQGRYGAVPYLGDFSQLFRAEDEDGKTH
ncbi:MAG: AAA family ATPase [Candidatus Sumerlaeota bacterium]|nr:AAA family ATPase [Candidatus Sumerlaeota bacterium]